MSGLSEILTKWAKPPTEMVDKLPKPTKRTNEPGKCRECGGWHGLPAVHLDYMGHAAVTRALIDVDPQWTWEPVSFDAAGSPMIVRTDKHLTLWGRLTVLGHTRICVGTCDAGKPEPEKELIGDLLRNGAMRFGIGLSLWAKEEWADLGPAPVPTPADVIERIGRQDDAVKADVKAYAKAKGYTVTKAALTQTQADDLGAWLDRRAAKDAGAEIAGGGDTGTAAPTAPTPNTKAGA